MIGGSLEGNLRSLGIRPIDLSLYERALRHRSTGRKESNERLEFLGDSVIATAVSRYLVERYPASDEGFLTRMRTKLVKGATQTILARKIGLGALIELSLEANESGKRDNDSVLEDALEAIIGAMFLDRGFDDASLWIRSLYEKYIDFSDIVQEEVSDKEKLLRISRQRGDALEFEHVRLIGDKHKILVRKLINSSLSGVVIGVGEGPCKKDATDDACKRGLRHYGIR